MVIKLWYLTIISLTWLNGHQALETPTIEFDSVGGQLGFIGDYAGLSPFKDSRQFESLQTNSIVYSDILDNTQIFNLFAGTNGSIETYCQLSETQFVLGGNFISTINSTQYNHIVQLDTNTRQLTPLQQGLDGPVTSVYCKGSDVYVGGHFIAPINSNISQYTGHVALWNGNQWSPLPWKGFNGPVYSIISHSDSVLFGGQFDSTGDGVYFNHNSSQSVNLAASAIISSGNGANFGDNTDPSSVVCSRSSWLLQDGMPGYWEAKFTTPVQPSTFRISNTHLDGRNTDSFSIISMASSEYFQLSYKHPVTNQVMTCSDHCLLSNDSSIPYQDFSVLVPMTTDGIRININTWYGTSGGLGGVEIFRSDVTLQPELPISNNTTSCSTSPSDTPSSIATTTGDWSQKYAYGTYQNFLVSTIPGANLHTENVSVTYQPYIAAQGLYNVYMITPGCVGTSTCDQRTQMQLTLEMTPGNSTTYVLDQRISSDQRALIYSGSISATTDAFKPSVVMRVAADATATSSTVSIIAGSIQFDRNTTGAILSGVLNYVPSNQTWTSLGQQLPVGAVVRTLQANDQQLFIGGQFNMNNTFSNVVAYNFATAALQPLSEGGLNGAVSSALLVNSHLVVGGSFNNTLTSQLENTLNHVAIYDIQSNSWSGMLQGVNGDVHHIYTTKNEHVHLSGTFNATTNAPTTPLFNNAEYDLFNNNWVAPTSFFLGPISNQIPISSTSSLYFGSIQNAQSYRANNVVSVTPSTITSSITLVDPNAHVSAGVFWNNNQILGGSFQLENTRYHLVIYHQDKWIGLLPNIQGDIRALAVIQNHLFIGGQFNSSDTITSFAMYDLEKQQLEGVSGIYSDMNQQQPGIINVMFPQPGGKAIYVAGNFSYAGLLNCNSICMLSTDTRQWTQVNQNISGNIKDMAVDDNDMVTVVGDLNLGTTKATLAWLDKAANTWQPAPNDMAIDSLSTLLQKIDSDYLVSGKRSNNNSGIYIGSWNGQAFDSFNSNQLGPSTEIRQLLWMPVRRSSPGSRYPSDSNTMLMAVGHIQLSEGSINASAALYDGTQWHPFLLSASANNQQGSHINRIFTANDCCTSASRIPRYLSVPAVILISIGISLGILFFVIACGFIVVFFKRRHQPAYRDRDETDPMKEWKPKYRPNSLLAMLNAAQLNDLAVGEQQPDNPILTEASGSTGYSTALQAGASASAAAAAAAADNSSPSYRGQASIDMTENNAARLRNSSGFSMGLGQSFSVMMANALKNNNNDKSMATEENPKVFYAKYAFEAKEFGELAFDGQTPIVVTDTSDNVWWMGYKDDGTGNPISGLFPSNYVTRIKPTQK